MQSGGCAAQTQHQRPNTQCTVSFVPFVRPSTPAQRTRLSSAATKHSTRIFPKKCNANATRAACTRAQKTVMKGSRRSRGRERGHLCSTWTTESKTSRRCRRGRGAPGCGERGSIPPRWAPQPPGGRRARQKGQRRVPERTTTPRRNSASAALARCTHTRARVKSDDDDDDEGGLARPRGRSAVPFVRPFRLGLVDMRHAGPRCP